MRRVLSDPEREEVVRRYLAGETLARLAAVFGVSKPTISRALRFHGVVCRSPRETSTVHRCDHTYFDDIFDEPRAYWLGFLFADGCVSASVNGTAAPILTLGLSDRDRGHVEAFRTAIGSTHKINEQPSTRSVRVGVPSAGLCAGLGRHGVVPRKSLIAVPPALPEHIVRHFWRGVFDGDGSIHKSHGRSPTLSLAGSAATCDAFAAWLSAVLDRPCRPYPIRSSRIWGVGIGGYHVVTRAAAALYDGATVFLPRKRAKYDEIASRGPIRPPRPPQLRRSV